MGELWCCRVLGPDDVYAAPDRETAQRWADETNAFVAQASVGHEDDPDWPHTKAVIAVWPWSTDAHAEALPKAIAYMTPQTEPTP